MATKEEETRDQAGPDQADPGNESRIVTRSGTDVDSPAEGELEQTELHDGTPANLGAIKYVHAAFFAAGILIAYLSGKVLAMVWNTLAEWPWIVERVPQLVRYGEDERATFSMLTGALIGILAVVQTYRKEGIRKWANEVATELSRVTWPNKETVTNGTMVVVIASAVATLYIALLDRFWSFVTNLVYGAS